MPTDYEKVYQQNQHALGEPTVAFVEFFAQYDKPHTEVLDLGCGQGRDALFIARLGHHVIGVDIAPTGIAQLLADAEREQLNIDGIVADLTEYEPDGSYDVVVLDRTLHMLDLPAWRHIFFYVSIRTRAQGYVLIADEPKNMPAFETFFEDDEHAWKTVRHASNLLFVQKQSKKR